MTSFEYFVRWYVPELILPLVCSFAVSAVLLAVFIPVLRKVKLGQKILEIGPSWHKCKEGTPIMGGLFFLFSTVLVILPYFFRNGISRPVAAVLLLALLSALTGFIDDYVKLFKKRNKGLSGKQKLVMQFLSAAVFLAFRAIVCGEKHHWLYYVIMLFVIVYVINCANLTDGIDGLAGSVALLICVFFICAVCNLYGETNVRTEEIIPLCAALIGGLLGFLLFNFHPAKIFMGDTGSLFLGGFVVGTAFALHMEFLLLPICFVWVAEGISVMLQVIGFKLTKKRIFRMAPIHHHFEMCGWSEVRIVFTFSVVTALTCAAAYFLMAKGVLPFPLID